MNKFRISWDDVWRLHGYPRRLEHIKTPPSRWLWYYHFDISISQLRRCLSAKKPATKARRLCKVARGTNLIGCIGGSLIYFDNIKNPDFSEVEKLVAKSLESK